MTQEDNVLSFFLERKEILFAYFAKAFFNYRDETRLLLPLFIMAKAFVRGRELVLERERERERGL